ncbi:MAG: VWA domain-containing protein [Ignavibacteria bacterium]|nr:VWA domain-containing protein [Ignavibacteria bacterium]MBK6418778.1 VWA domain-containing protein [Ignavibacteria bacterium]MBK7411675.1 VWA domain-containing protein [Ignavibacteria bacterium]
MKSRITVLILAILCSATSAWSVGALFVRPLNSSQNFALMSIRTYDAVVTIQDHVATTHVDQTFKNEMGSTVEATFIFPLPDGAMVTDLFYWFNGKRYRANVREKKEAQAAYDAKIRVRLDPALLQELGDNVYKLNIAPINPNSDVRFEITYTEIMPYELSTGTYTHLLKATGLSPKPLERISLKIDAKTQNTWKSIVVPHYGSTPANSMTYVTPNQTLVAFGDENYMPTRNYVVQLQANRESIEMATLTYVPVPSDSFGTDPFFMSWVLPPDEDSKPLPRSIVFIADVSSSMEGERIVQLRAALSSFLDQLTPADKFNIVTFSTGVVSFKSDIVDASPENIAAARDFVRTRTALGLTNIADAIHAGLTHTYAPNTAQVAVFLTDGEPSWGEVREIVILDSIKRWNTQNVRIYPIAVGSDLKLSLLNAMAKSTGGFVTQVERDDSISVIVENHLRRISMPNLTDLVLSYGSLQTIDVLPAVLPNVPVGGRVSQHGRYVTGGVYPVTLNGTLLNAPFTLTKDVLFGDPVTNNRAVARLWARAKVNALLEEIQRIGERKELVDAVIDLSIRFNILTKYTAMYADPDDPRDDPTGVPGDERPIEIVQVSVSPNPVTDVAHLSVRIPAHQIDQQVSVKIIDHLGRVVATLYDGWCNGSLDLDWNCMDTAGQHITRGAYSVVVNVGDRTTSSLFIIQ